MPLLVRLPHVLHLLHVYLPFFLVISQHLTLVLDMRPVRHQPSESLLTFAHPKVLCEVGIVLLSLAVRVDVALH